MDPVDSDGNSKQRHNELIMRDQVSEEIDLDELREFVLRRLPSGTTSDSKARVDEYVATSTFVRSGFANIPFDDGKMWIDESDRAQSRFMHGFIFFSDWPQSIKDDSSGSLARVCLEIVRLWHSMFSARNSSNRMSYHDETTAQRLVNLLAVRYASLPYLLKSDIKWLDEILDETAKILEDSNFHSTGNNHGMFQDVALINYSVLANWLSDKRRTLLFQVGKKRIQEYFIDCFTAEGVHRENSPTYHLMICQQLKSHRDLLLTVNHPDVVLLSGILNKASAFATHSVMPSGSFPPVSDTVQKSLVWYARNIFDYPEFTYAASLGRFGTAPKTRVLVLPVSGYAIYRSSWIDREATFAYFHAAYNADYHKHSDDLSFLLSSAGVDLLTEAGPHGYNYDDPMTVFAYGQYAHNNLVVNRRSVRRTDNQAKTVKMTVNQRADNSFSVTGITGRLYETQHRRTIDIYEVDGETKIDVSDSVISDSEKHYELLWNLGPDVLPVVHGQGFELFHKGKKVMDAFFSADVALKVSLHRGEREPSRLGWRCPTFGIAEPNYVIVVSFEGKEATVATKFRLKSFSYTDRGLLNIEPAWQRFQGDCNLNYMLRPAASSEGARVLVVVFSAISGMGDFTYNYFNSLEDSSANVLYILDDFGNQGSYYYSDHGNTYIYEATQKLIRLKLEELGLNPEDLVTAGSSKGGAAALIHGLAAGAGDIFVGAPQFLIGSFLEKAHPNILEFMTGGLSDARVGFLDGIVKSSVDSVERWPRVSILVGDSDHHYKTHVLPFASYVKSISRDISLDVRPGLPHSEIGRIYAGELQRYIALRIERMTNADVTAPLVSRMKVSNLDLYRLMKRVKNSWRAGTLVENIIRKMRRR